MLRSEGPAGSKTRTLWSEKEYGDIELIYDWRLARKAGPPTAVDRCGVVIGGGHGVQLMTDETGTIHTAPAADPTAREAKGMKPPGQWNRYRIRRQGERVTVDLNGVSVLANARVPGLTSPRGPITLRADGGPVEFANIFVRELKG
jgi:3-keto-disaccharide hydrolase